jgi:hypothetical protein
MKGKIRFFLFLFTLSFSCNDEEVGTSSELTVCNDASLSACITPQNVSYCTFGYKFGMSNPFSPRGAGIAGPNEKANQISYKFQGPGIIFKTTRQNKAISLQFSEDDKSTIRTTISKWSSVANLEFVEKASNEISDITIISAFIPVGGSGGGQLCAFGNPRYSDEPCKQIAGYMILNPRCRPLSIPMVLHEMGHVLGLGHVLSENVMNQNRSFTYDELQSGDILGVQSIYGAK